MKTHPQTLRTAAVALFASAAFLNAPVFGQAAPVVAPPPPVVVTPPPPVAETPPPVVRPAPAPAPRATPAEPPRAAPAAPEARRTARPAQRAPERSVRIANRSAPAPAAPAASAPETTPAAPAPAPVAEATLPPPVAEPAPAAPAEPAGDVAVVDTESSTVTWLVAAGLALVIALAGIVLWRRRRSAEDDYYYEEPAYEEPANVVEPAAPVARADYQPALVTPAFRRPETAPVVEPEVTASATGIELGEADRADMEALAASSSPEGHRPWLEFLMRPVRAGTTDDEALVEFELTVGNTGTVAAEHVRISTWMLAGQGSDMERSLIEPPADAATSETRIAPGDGARVDAAIALPRNRLRDDVLPVVVADARYRLPGGGEGRTSARFAVGLPSGDGLAPFAVALGEGLRDDVEVRLHGEPEHV
ncbi:LPXTG cell wall anchor domain-containing protein [Sphingosinicella sp.]|uniref:LPXTG cell wall anchor domain-containing protein n=1 Tax=Sphingosinicella sp. TaxID=1917971 RepID=UPI004037DAC0